MNLIYDDRKISWEFEGKRYEYFIDGIRQAAIEKDYIFVVSRDSKSSTHTYIRFNGLLIASIKLGQDEKIVKVIDESNKEIALKIYELNFMIYHSSYLYAIIEEENKNRKVVQYSIHGQKLKEYICPEGYSLYRFCGETETTIEFVIYDSEEISWKFSLNTETGEWVKIGYIRD
jgi:hypothetical protein